ncbi:MAG: HAMP domain-containing histidine kinase [Oscillospiraceae bacterium]|nr:HAMP domain-containing histidine kinase [Oscillospiraceae bacterium]MBP3521175.1 HAMP domain-containing histidine kinase [Oscillospiraceae bacterium]
MILAVLLLTVLCVFLLLRIYALERNLRQGASQLKNRKAEGSAAPLRLAAPNPAAEELMAQVNGLLREMEDQRSDFRNREQALRRQIANVSHDLRTPLTSILGYLQLLEKEELSPEERREYLSTIESRARVLQGLITSFYDLSRLEAGEYPILREKVDLREVLGELLAAYYDELEAHFDVTVDLPEDLPQVWGDRAAMTRVYSNLLRNAMEHGSGTLSISAWSGNGEVSVRVSNGGAELTDEDLPHVFDRFYTTDKTRSGRNTGLGLAIVKALAYQMEGRAEAELTGDQFSIILYWKA